MGVRWGRKLNKESIERLRQAIVLGATYEDACKYAGFSYDSLNNWVNHGKDIMARYSEHLEDEFDLEDVIAVAELDEFDFKCVQLIETIKKAEGEATVGWLAKIENAANSGNWTAAAWKLERRRHGYEMGTVDVNLTGADTGPTDEEYNPGELGAIVAVLRDIGIIPTGATEATEGTDTPAQ